MAWGWGSFSRVQTHCCVVANIGVQRNEFRISAAIPCLSLVLSIECNRGAAGSLRGSPPEIRFEVVGRLDKGQLGAAGWLVNE